MIILRQKQYNYPGENRNTLTQIGPGGEKLTFVLPEGKEAYMTTAENGRPMFSMRDINYDEDPYQKALRDQEDFTKKYMGYDEDDNYNYDDEYEDDYNYYNDEEDY